MGKSPAMLQCRLVGRTEYVASSVTDLTGMVLVFSLPPPMSAEGAHSQGLFKD